MQRAIRIMARWFLIGITAVAVCLATITTFLTLQLALLLGSISEILIVCATIVPLAIITGRFWEYFVEVLRDEQTKE